MRIAPVITLSPEQRTVLESQVRSRSLPLRVVERSRIVLFAAAGRQDKDISVLLSMSPEKGSPWRKRFLALGVAGLLQDAPRPGRKPTISARLTQRVVTMTPRQPPTNATHWSTRTMAAAVGISEASVRRIWRAHGLKPHRVETFKISNDPAFAEKTGRHRRPVPEPARTRAGAVRGREEPDSGSGPHPTGPAVETRTRRDHDPRLQTQRHGYSVRRPECGQRRGLVPLPRAAPASGMAQVFAFARSKYARASRTPLDRRQLRYP